MPDPAGPAEHPYWRRGVLYQVYPRSFGDASGDGIGDLPGVIAHLEYLEWLGIDAIWLNPITRSPDKDMGYDVSDYCAVQPAFGTLEDVKRLVAEAGRRGIRVLLDLVPNHTSDQHPWFQDARRSKTAGHRDWYLWADPKPDGAPPNNWVSHFGGPAWTLDQRTQQYYLHSFDPGQPDLNWRTPQVAAEFEKILRFWFDLGVAGFRIDVAHGMIKDSRLRDNPLAGPDDPERVQRLGQRLEYNFDQPEVHDILRAWRRIADGYDRPRVLIGETDVYDIARLRRYYSRGDELHLAFNFPFMHSPFDAVTLQAVAEETQAAILPQGWPVWTLGNHDVSRYPTRWARGDRDRIRCALTILFGLRGTPVLYYGDEIGMPDTRVPFEAMTDPIALRNWPARTGRDACRTPMPWKAGEGGGFTRPGVKPWLPFGDLAACNVAEQREDPASTLWFTRELVNLRRSSADLQEGAYRSLPSSPRCWAWRRGRATTVAVNLSDQEGEVRGVMGEIRLCTRRDRDGGRLGGRLALRPWEAVIAVGNPP